MLESASIVSKMITTCIFSDSGQRSLTVMFFFHKGGQLRKKTFHEKGTKQTIENKKTNDSGILESLEPVLRDELTENNC